LHTGFCGLIEITEADLGDRGTKYLDEYEAIFETGLGLTKKTGGKKSRVPLNKQLNMCYEISSLSITLQKLFHGVKDIAEIYVTSRQLCKSVYSLKAKVRGKYFIPIPYHYSAGKKCPFPRCH
jgi:hypothetical protein